ncbi:MAG: hypothetical protein A2758_02040 [Candidatus Zambryskibacteria bacterium RIFCSPHIGHO2_01_FULL_49_18]|uniref:RecF/RecN/SMC N-terminal domain-containing protein n=2 Tax=Candidatus Zambryskiibacteriota TaxID=1817925 RepID=A0A1G2T1U6_9BACT|nr:MAG: hypothetical protein A2758_02040 [Candidatus Zambryskibacteria bacterium RIFCSPHIGHO2_01_FULL_49_18]OHB06115.1 MAG: hypothetical protein A3A26_01000 [Candidatus Zambryskibacteria bacterium RIFCSPLOWO2_01_FULL_47_14]
MHLKSIELSGFKSFAKKSDFEFNTPISAIVGPNGSGKSNVAEAFRFVLGEQSIKSMRGKKGEDLIWNGSNDSLRANRASVKVIFDNSRRMFNIDFPEVSIERVVHRDGVNEYLVNGSQVRLKDVIELLASAHIGASGHHIISQGEADKVVSTNPKDRKAMVEDALGLKLYQYKRIESEKKLEKTFENIAQVEALRREIAPHLKFLEKQVEKLAKTESLRTDLIKISQEYFKREDFYILTSKVALKEERGPIDRALEKLSKESAEAKKVIEFESGLSEARKVRDDLTRELGKIEGLIMAEEKSVASEESKVVSLKDVEKLYQEISLFSEITKIFERVKTFIQERRGIVEARRPQIGELKTRKSEIEAELKIAREKEDEITKAEKAVFRIMSEEQGLVSRLNLLKAREEKIALEEAEFKRELEEVGYLAGAEALRFQVFALSEEEMTSEPRVKQEERKRMLERNKLRLEDSNTAGGEELKKEHAETSERDAFLARELLDLEQSAESLKSLIKDLEERLATEFETGIEKINKEFNTLFNKMFGGGEARLILVKTESLVEEGEKVEKVKEVEEGLEIKVSLPRKKVKSLMMLSGGERALTSIALIFAISQVNPPPFIILDETDAALDEANSKKYGDLVEELSKKSQLILITHNRETMSRAGIIYGVTMAGNGVSKLLSISFDEAVEVAK